MKIQLFEYFFKSIRTNVGIILKQTNIYYYHLPQSSNGKDLAIKIFFAISFAYLVIEAPCIAADPINNRYKDNNKIFK